MCKGRAEPALTNGQAPKIERTKTACSRRRTGALAHLTHEDDGTHEHNGRVAAAKRGGIRATGGADDARSSAWQHARRHLAIAIARANADFLRRVPGQTGHNASRGEEQ